MFHLKSKPRPPLAVVRVTPGQVVDSSATVRIARLARVERIVDLADEGDRLEILLAAVDVRHPGAGLPGVVEVEHRRNGVDTKPVDVEFLRPVVRIGDQEVAHLVAAVVEDIGSPVGVLTAARVGMLVERRPVESRERPPVAWKVSRHPVEDHADAVAVHDLDEAAEIVRRAMPRGRRVVPGDLVSPRSTERVLHDRQQLHVGEPQGKAVGRERLGDLAIVQGAAVGITPPGTEVNLIGRKRRLVDGRTRAGAHPRAIAPPVPALLDDARRAGRVIRGPGQGIGLEDAHAVAARDQELVADACADSGAEQLPHSRATE